MRLSCVIIQALLMLHGAVVRDSRTENRDLVRIGLQGDGVDFRVSCGIPANGALRGTLTNPDT